eukprot:jgi/Botrbrau1/7791/Bobra.0159s0219.1
MSPRSPVYASPHFGGSLPVGLARHEYVPAPQESYGASGTYAGTTRGPAAYGSATASRSLWAGDLKQGRSHACTKGKKSQRTLPEFDKSAGPLGAPPISRSCFSEPCPAVSGAFGPWSACLRAAVEQRTERAAAVFEALMHDVRGLLRAWPHATRPPARACASRALRDPTAGYRLALARQTQKRTAVPPSASARVPKRPAPCAVKPVPFDSSGACCASAAAAVGASLDAAGKCCEGVVDACGVCGGSARTVDFTGACCDGVLDAGGRCCPTPMRLDALGVCGGNSSSGSIIIEASGSSSDATGAMVKELAHEMGVPSSQAGYGTSGFAYGRALRAYYGENAVEGGYYGQTDAVAPARQPGQRRLLSLAARLLTAGTVFSSGTVLPAPSPYTASIPQQMLSWPLAGHSGHSQRRSMRAHPLSSATESKGQYPGSIGGLESVYGGQGHVNAGWQAIGGDGGNETVVTVLPPLPPHYYPHLLRMIVNESSATFVGDVQNFKLAGQPNNGLCEVGELPTAHSPGVPSDCPLAFRGAPVAGNRICGGHGTPVHALGKCLCYTGYDGYACTSCAVGYQLINGLCQRSYESFVAGDSSPADGIRSFIPQSAGSIKGSTVPIVACVFGGVLALGLICGYIFYLRRRRRNAQLAQPRRPQSPDVAKRDSTWPGLILRGGPNAGLSGIAWAIGDTEQDSIGALPRDLSPALADVGSALCSRASSTTNQAYYDAVDAHSSTSSRSSIAGSKRATREGHARSNHLRDPYTPYRSYGPFGFTLSPPNGDSYEEDPTEEHALGSLEYCDDAASDDSGHYFRIRPQSAAVLLSPADQPKDDDLKGSTESVTTNPLYTAAVSIGASSASTEEIQPASPRVMYTYASDKDEGVSITSLRPGSCGHWG